MGEYFETPAELGLFNRLPFGEASPASSADTPKELYLQISTIFLIFAFGLAVLLAVLGKINTPLIFVMSILFLGYLVTVFPNINLAASEYGELMTTFLLVILVPAFGLLIITGEFHRLLWIVAFPLSALHYSMLIVIQLPMYASNTAKNKTTLLTRLGWRRGIQLHNLLVLTAFLMVGLAISFGFPSRMALSVFLALPFGVFQVWSLIRLTEGAPTRWKALTLTSVGTFALATYSFAYNFWIS